MMEFLVITGRSGAGKSSCLHLLEDLGYYEIDNLPITMLPELPAHLGTKDKIAVGIDVRNLPDDPQIFPNILEQLENQGINPSIIYLETDDKTLLERFSATRRKHPLTNETISLQEALAVEHVRLDPLIQRAKYRIDSSRLSIHELQNRLRHIVGAKLNNITLLFQSFGYKYGVPRDSDYVFDVRCLPNPYWDDQLRSLTGRDPAVMDFFNQKEKVDHMVKSIAQFVESWLPAYREDNRNYMTISIGCTGGHHRSVFVAERLYEYFKQHTQDALQLRHRELHD